MSAPLGNQFWKLRSKHGRDRLFATPELLWEAATEYFQWCDDNPWYKSEQAKGNGKPEKNEDGTYSYPPNLIEVPTSRPYTLHGLCLYLDCSTGYFREFKKDCSEDFVSVVTRIEEVVYKQKFEGAAVGMFNSNIIARDLGLADKTDVAATVSQPMNDDQVDRIIEAIRSGKTQGNDK